MGREERARIAREIADGVTKLASNKGLLVETGWVALLATFYKDVPEERSPQLREAFFLGAHHLFASIMNVLDPGSEPTEADLRRMDLINHELEAFQQVFKQQRGVSDEFIPPELGAQT